MLQVNVWAIAHDPAVWPSPFKFDPSRFLPGGGNHHVDARGQDFRLLAFGSGRRQCIGYDLATDMMARMLSAVVREFDIAVAPGRGVSLEERPGVTAAMDSPLELILTPRRGLRESSRS